MPWMTKRRFRATAIFVAVAWVILCGVYTVIRIDAEERAAGASLQGTLDLEASAVVARLEGEFHTAAIVAKVSALNSGVMALLEKLEPGRQARSALDLAARNAALSADADVIGMCHYLEDIGARTKYTSILVLDASGIYVAGNIGKRQEILLGNDYSFRTYFQLAMEHGSANETSVGKVIRVPAIFFGEVVPKDGRRLGVVVFRRDLESLAPLLEVPGAEVMVSDDKGVIVASSRPEWVLRPLVPSGSLAPPVPADIASGADRQPDGRNWLWTSRELHGSRLTVWLTAPLSNTAIRDHWIVSFLMFSAIGLLTVAAAAVGAAHLRNTQRRRQEEMVYEALERKVADRTQELARRNEEQSRFISMLSHELRMPLSVIRMALRKDGPLGQANQRRCIQAVGDINDVMECCLYADRLEHGRIELAPEPVDLAALLKAAAESLPEGNRIDIRAADLPVLQADRRIISVIVNNLIGNAVKYGHPGTPVDVQAQSDGTMVVLTVSNAIGAAGFPDPEKVFGKYYRSPQACGKTGSGLGLFIAASFARMIGGDLRYLPDETAVRFELRVPV